MPARYTALQSVPDPERELHDAFHNDEDDDEQLESTPLTQAHNHAVAAAERTNQTPGTYDFERDYDCPPPGSPPGPSAFALPNNIGNSNGQLPESPVRQFRQPSFFRRALGGILPTYYAPVPAVDSSARVGGGVENDGVFANVMAKPGKAKTVRTENGEVHVVPEDSARDAPPTYADAQADTVPPYWETTVHAPSGLDGSDILVDELPAGSVFIFATNLFTSFFFQFVGFILTYLLHTSHAAKYGSRAGLGLTLIQYGFYSRVAHGTDGPVGGGDGAGDGIDWLIDEPKLPEPPSSASTSSAEVSPSDSPFGISSKEWMSFLLMTLGWFFLLSSIIGYWRVKHWEMSIRSSHRGSITPEDINRDIAIRRNIEQVFGIGTGEGDEEESGARQTSRRNETGGLQHSNPIPDQQTLHDARLARDLRAAGLM
ncbi:hypothetical protein PILCRDRAFT_87611 [Piloderma croceum F 1598]|uniref:Metal homeostatis protein bsd2 n=1 Tax=Piloderma croceum (strain F 1598) TaxID=765440 RepID=A0A0C3G0H4_PILCF|nr:hypothetical protein PILCRDRAFT_87611 [Piloderma croceum F 1598]